MERPTRGVQGDVIKLRAKSDVARKGQVQPAAAAERRSVARAKPANIHMGAASQSLNERRDTPTAGNGKTRPAHICVGVGVNSGLRGVVETEVADDAEQLPP